MKIATRLKLLGLFSAAVVCVIGAVLFSTAQQMRQELRKNEAANDIMNGVTGLR